MVLGIIDGASNWVDDQRRKAETFVDNTIDSADRAVTNTTEAIGDAVDSAATQTERAVGRVFDEVEQLDPLSLVVGGIGTTIAGGVAREVLLQGVNRYAPANIKTGVDMIVDGMKMTGSAILDTAEDKAKQTVKTTKTGISKAGKAAQTGVEVAGKASKAVGREILDQANYLSRFIPTKGTDAVGNLGLEIGKLGKTQAADDFRKVGRMAGHFGKAAGEVGKGIAEGGEVVARRTGQAAKAGGKAVSGTAKTLGKGVKAGGKAAGLPLIGAAFELGDRDYTGAAAELGDLGIMALGPVGVGAVLVTMAGTTTYGLATGKHEYIGTGPMGLIEVGVTGD